MKAGPVAALIAIGAAWGLTMPLSRIAVSTGHGPFGLMLWQLVVGALAMTVLGLVRRRGLPLHGAALKTYVIIAVVGALLPNTLSYSAIAHLPAGVMAVILSLVPMVAFPIALGMGLERFRWRRFLGLGLGLIAVLVLVVPGSAFAGDLPVVWLMAAVLVTVAYGFEGNYVARFGTGGCDPLEVLWGATLFGAVVMGPVVWFSGQWIPLDRFDAPEQAQVALSLVSVLAYAGYVWLVGRAGPVFAVQVSYAVTLFGVFWALVLLGERYPSGVWVALALMLGGMVLVQPRRSA